MDLNVTFDVFGKATVGPDWTITKRENISIFHYVISGRAVYIHDNKEYTMLPGHIYILPYSTKCIRKTIDNIPFEHIFFDFLSPVLITEIIDIDATKYKDIHYTLKGLTEFFEFHTDKNDGFYYFQFRHHNQFISETATLYFNTIMNLVDNVCPISNKYDKRVLLALEYIHKHYSDTLTIQELADCVHLEKFYFAKLFKKHMKMPPHEYIRKYRLDIAMSMLKSGLSVTEVYERCGYQSSCTFSIAFKKEFGLPPSQI